MCPAGRLAGPRGAHLYVLLPSAPGCAFSEALPSSFLTHCFSDDDEAFCKAVITWLCAALCSESLRKMGGSISKRAGEVLPVSPGSCFQGDKVAAEWLFGIQCLKEPVSAERMLVPCCPES